MRSKPRRVVFAAALAALAVAGCNLLLGLESNIQVIPADAATASDALAAEASCTGPSCTFCESLPSLPGAPVLACNDFDKLDSTDAGDFGLNRDGLPTIGTSMTFELEREAPQTKPNALAVNVEPGTGIMTIGGTAEVSAAPDKASAQFDVSYGPDEAMVDAAVPNRTIGLALLLLNADNDAIIFGVDARQYFINVTSLTALSSSELSATAVKVGTEPAPGPAYLRVGLAVRRQKCAEGTGGELAAVLLIGGVQVKCKQIPAEMKVEAPTRLFVGGYVKDPVVPMRWRFDNIVIRQAE